MLGGSHSSTKNQHPFLMKTTMKTCLAILIRGENHLMRIAKVIIGHQILELD
jgi:hypothetical protein